MQTWAISSKWVLSNHQGVMDPRELESSENKCCKTLYCFNCNLSILSEIKYLIEHWKPVLNLILQFWIGQEDVSVSVIGEDNSFLLVGVADDHLVVVCKILNKEENLSLFECSEDSFVLWRCMRPVLSGQENCHLQNQKSTQK